MKKWINDNDLILEELLVLKYEFTKPILDPELFVDVVLYNKVQKMCEGSFGLKRDWRSSIGDYNLDSPLELLNAGIPRTELFREQELKELDSVEEGGFNIKRRRRLNS